MAGPERVGLLAVAAVCQGDTGDGIVDDGDSGEVPVCGVEGDGCSSAEAEDGGCGGIT